MRKRQRSRTPRMGIGKRAISPRCVRTARSRSAGDQKTCLSEEEKTFSQLRSRISLPLTRRFESLLKNKRIRYLKVLDCYVIGVPSSRLGEEVAAYIQLKDDSVTKEDIIAFCKEGLARYKLPKYIQFTDEFPKTVTGKIQKFLLREQAMEDFPELKAELAAMQ